MSASYKDKIQLLTLTPKSWSISKAIEFFGVTQYMVRRAIYEDDEYSRQLPGQKDCITVDGVKVSKRLMLVKIEELYRTFKQKHQDLKIGLSKFCSMRPKWCILVGSKGTHSVCTCIQHENAKLLASETDFDYKVHYIFSTSR